MTRYEARVKSMEIVYRWELGVDSLEPEEEKDFVRELLINVEEHLAEIEELIKKALINWTFDRLGYLEKSILLLGVGELLCEKEIPLNVTINEWVEIGKTYCGTEAKKLINGVLNEVKNLLISTEVRHG